jgi:protein O-mannosyl-transferase
MTNASPRPAVLALLASLVCAAVLATHWPALSARAISFDDRAYVLENPLVLHPSADSLGRFFGEVLRPSTVRGYYHPLAMTSLMLDVGMGGGPENFEPFHRTSLALHALNALLVFVLLQQLFGNAAVAAIVALLFGVHPMTVETIPWLGERKTLLAAFFALASLCLYVRYATRGSRAAYAGSLAAFVLALLSKPTSIGIAPALLVIDAWPLRRLRWRTLIEVAPFLALAVVAAVLTFLSQKNSGGIYLPTQEPPARAPLTLLHNLVFYPSQIAWPAHLSSYYAFPHPFDLSNRAVLAGVVGTPILLAVLALSLGFTRAIVAGWLVFMLVIFPTLGVIGFTGVIAADKYAYLAMVGVLLIGAWALDRAWRAGPRRRAAVVAVALGLAAAEAVAAHRYLAVFQDTETLYRHMLEREPTASVLHEQLGTEFLKQGRVDEAMARWETAIRYWPGNYAAHFNLGVELEHRGRIDEAMQHYAAAATANPDDLAAHFNLGVQLAKRNRLDDAERELREVLRIDPSDAEAQRLLVAVRAKRQSK